ncbi:MAG: hypothetical protein K5790_03570 [Nitrosopumilus sp.]|uniref:hypothetical protein n=1 Tax=Nitrosopumilus sp. TaxID=2024843 RepID=UPI00247B3545|nr:hypothetical protein [Nitrosopumilus sp.]MCV0392358.1 hypothetical protein [Nitrosopumilus sp.]
MEIYNQLVYQASVDVLTSILGKKVYAKLESDLEKIWKTSMKYAIMDFDQFHEVLKRQFGPASDKLLEEIRSKVISEATPFNEIKSVKSGDSLKIQDELLVKKILSGYGDSELRQLLQLWTHPLLCVDAIQNSTLPQTSAYRKINSMIKSGLLLQDGEKIVEGRKVPMYRPTFSKVQVDFSQKGTTLLVQVA